MSTSSNLSPQINDLNGLPFQVDNSINQNNNNNEINGELPISSPDIIQGEKQSPTKLKAKPNDPEQQQSYINKLFQGITHSREKPVINQPKLTSSSLSRIAEDSNYHNMKMSTLDPIDTSTQVLSPLMSIPLDLKSSATGSTAPSYTGSSNMPATENNHQIPMYSPAHTPLDVEDYSDLIRLVFSIPIQPTVPKKKNILRTSDGGGSISHNPQISSPPINQDIMNVTVHQKSPQDVLLNKLRVLQFVHYHKGPIWALKFSPDGTFLCTAGKDKQVVVWCVGYTIPPSSPVPAHTNLRLSGISRGSDQMDEVEGALFGIDPNSPMSVMSPDGMEPIDRQDSNASFIDIQRQSSFEEGRHTLDFAQSSTRQHSGNNDNSPIREEVVYSLNNKQYTSSNEFLHKRPHRVFLGHEADIVDICWSKSLFILSASIDKSVRLWHVTKQECLGKFNHPDLLTSVEFHPEMDRYFVSGCWDRKVRVWDIIENNVREWAQAPDHVTAVKFTPDGKHIAAGLFNGQVYFYDYDGMKYITQMNCRTRSGRFSHGTKVTALHFVFSDQNTTTGTGRISASSSVASTPVAGGASGLGASSVAGSAVGRRRALTDNQIMVTTNDSSIRLYSTVDYSLNQKFKGLLNSSMQIKAFMSENRQYLICGSDDGRTFIWSTKSSPKKSFLRSLFPSMFGSSRNKSTQEQIAGNSSPLRSSSSFTPISHSELKNASYEYFDTNKYYHTQSVATTAAVFAPSLSFESILREHSKVLLLPNYESIRHDVSVYGRNDLCTRIVVTADFEGRLTILVRGV